MPPAVPPVVRAPGTRLAGAGARGRRRTDVRHADARLTTDIIRTLLCTIALAALARAPLLHGRTTR
ncbi:hypothetical protein [Streptomyces sp. gCLA4]|uniref:hypothetical protein n=1 Tax=Streptomyces sp. gCLA4 TaxID=1873416 RepID=UPI0016040F3C|nr:hypothetical protein [Streptomyces sp. gCLA4]